jgi:hypothetical protein
MDMMSSLMSKLQTARMTGVERTAEVTNPEVTSAISASNRKSLASIQQIPQRMRAVLSAMNSSITRLVGVGPSSAANGSSASPGVGAMAAASLASVHVDEAAGKQPAVPAGQAKAKSPGPDFTALFGALGGENDTQAGTDLLKAARRNPLALNKAIEAQKTSLFGAPGELAAKIEQELAQLTGAMGHPKPGSQKPLAGLAGNTGPGTPPPSYDSAFPASKAPAQAIDGSKTDTSPPSYESLFSGAKKPTQQPAVPTTTPSTDFNALFAELGGDNSTQAAEKILTAAMRDPRGLTDAIESQKAALFGALNKPETKSPNEAAMDEVLFQAFDGPAAENPQSGDVRANHAAVMNELLAKQLRGGFTGELQTNNPKAAHFGAPSELGTKNLNEAAMDEALFQAFDGPSAENPQGGDVHANHAAVMNELLAKQLRGGFTGELQTNNQKTAHADSAPPPTAGAPVPHKQTQDVPNPQDGDVRANHAAVMNELLARQLRGGVTGESQTKNQMAGHAAGGPPPVPPPSSGPPPTAGATTPPKQAQDVPKPQDADVYTKHEAAMNKLLEQQLRQELTQLEQTIMMNFLRHMGELTKQAGQISG